MHTNLVEWTEWALIPATVILLAAIHRLDLLAIVIPSALLAAYAMCSGGCPKHERTGRKM